MSITDSSGGAYLIYCLHLQSHHHFHGDSLYPECYINNVIINNVCGRGWLGLGFVYFRDKVVWLEKKSSLARLEREI